MTWTCGTCWREFVDWQAREQHMDALGHDEPAFECETCNRYFGSKHAAEQHMDALDHWGSDDDYSNSEWWYCDERGCSARFWTKAQLDRHNENVHLYCDPCDRYFNSSGALQQHLKTSRAHLGTTIKCPLCGVERVSATSVIQHLEGGHCPRAPFDRDELYRLLRERDPKGHITKKLAGHQQTVRYEATESAWNAKAQWWECYFCHRGFTSKVALNGHLNSPTHQQALYRCPNRAKCGREFTTLAAVINHLESESCSYMRFEAVQQKIENITARMGLVTFD